MVYNFLLFLLNRDFFLCFSCSRCGSEIGDAQISTNCSENCFSEHKINQTSRAKSDDNIFHWEDICAVKFSLHAISISSRTNKLLCSIPLLLLIFNHVSLEQV
jgi:hypothetical protein